MKANTKHCPVKGCVNLIADDREACDECIWGLHVELCRLSGITDKEAIRVEWERKSGPQNN